MPCSILAEVAGVEVAGVAERIAENPCLGVPAGDVESRLGYEGVGHLGGKFPECLPHMFHIGIYVEVVGVHCRDRRDFRMELEE